MNRYRRRLLKEFRRGQASIQVRMSGPGIDDAGPVYFMGMGAQGEIVFKDRADLVKYADTAGAWPIRWVMTIEGSLPLDELMRAVTKTTNEKIAEESARVQARWEATLREAGEG